MTNPIKKIDVKDSVPSGLEVFEWIPNGGLNVITGLNGSGKTKLLKYIHDNYKRNHEIRFVDLNYKPPTFSHVGELESIHSRNEDGEIINGQGGNTGWKNNKEAISNHYLPNIDKDIIKEIMDIRSSFNSFCDSNSEINLIGLEKQWIDSEHLAPWNDLNGVFKDFGLDINIAKQDLSGRIQFIKSSNPKPYNPVNLSSGEQVAYSLALWQWGSGVNKKSEVLLIDEFDAHLNPSLIKNYMSVIREHFVKKGVQVIMTTHNPLITSLLEEDEIFWMEKGRIINKSRSSIANTLADDLFSARDLEGIFEIFGGTGRIPEKILLVEGKHDELRILRNLKDDNIKILDCKCADNIPMFAKLPYVQNDITEKKPTILCLLDHDGKGVDSKKCIDKIAEEKPFGNSIKAIYVSETKGEIMEDVVKDEDKMKNLKERIKTAFLE